jgi:amidase
LLVMPVLSTPAVRVGHWKSRSWVMTMLRASSWIWTQPWNLAGVPAATVPARLSADGLPVAVQLVAAPGGEKTLLEVARQLEQVRPWPRAPQLRTRTRPVETRPMQAAR